jgi:hypothetical protein
VPWHGEALDTASPRKVREFAHDGISLTVIIKVYSMETMEEFRSDFRLVFLRLLLAQRTIGAARSPPASERARR